MKYGWIQLGLHNNYSVSEGIRSQVRENLRSGYICTIVSFNQFESNANKPLHQLHAERVKDSITLIFHLTLII